jgi:NitT/TauT family transport system substrate-binding protein
VLDGPLEGRDGVRVPGGEVRGDRSVLESTLPTYTGISPDTAALIALGTWPPTLDRTRLQRVADLMRQYGVLTGDVDTGTMILAEAR